MYPYKLKNCVIYKNSIDFMYSRFWKSKNEGEITMFVQVTLTKLQGLLNMKFDQYSYFAQYPLLSSSYA